MILHPAILALMLVSLAGSAVLVYAASFSVRVAKSWDLASGSEAQLALERRTYLVSTMLACVFVFEVTSLFLFVALADQLHGLFSGAMCATGTLNVNGYGYPALILKVVNAVLAGQWLMLNHADNSVPGYPLTKRKYVLLAALAPLFVAGCVVQTLYFLHLRPDIITSCCGALFDVERQGLSAGLDVFGPVSGPAIFAASHAALVACGLLFLKKGQGVAIFSLLSGITFVVSVVALISFISPYIYELPTHHCPFCILQPEYRYVGYLFYATALGGVIPGVGAGSIALFGAGRRLSIAPELQVRLVRVSMAAFLLFFAASIAAILLSRLSMTGTALS